MSKKIGVTAVLIAVVMVAMAFAGCVGDGSDADWKNPTQITFDSMDVNELNETVEITFSLGDKDDAMTRATGTVRVAIWDTDGFEMLNSTYEVKAKDFDSLTILGIKISTYTFEIPFSEFQKSHDRDVGFMDDGNEMNGRVSFTFKETTFSGDYEWFLPTIPEGLLHPNDAPQADLMVSNPGYVGMAVECNASASTDPEGGDLLFEWDWGDGDTVAFGVGTGVESHIYDIPGTYTITVTVKDYEEATATRTMDVTVDWSLAITVNGWGIVADGDYINQTYVELFIDNMAPEETATPQAGVSGIKLKNAADEMTDDNGTDVAIPETIAVDGDVTVMIYFDPVDGFTPTKIDVWGREFTLP
jgi:hypothetical protein